MGRVWALDFFCRDASTALADPVATESKPVISMECTPAWTSDAIASKMAPPLQGLA